MAPDAGFAALLEAYGLLLWFRFGMLRLALGWPLLLTAVFMVASVTRYRSLKV